MNLIKKIVTGISDSLTRDAVLRTVFRLHNDKMLAPVTLTINGAGNAAARHNGSSAALGLVNGVPVKIAAGQVMPALTGVSIANGSKGVVGWAVDAGGSLILLWNGQTSTLVSGVKFPQVPDGYLAVGYAFIENGTGSTFTGGTTALDAGALTVTYINQVDAFQPLTEL